jgi:hypothetical protein
MERKEAEVQALWARLDRSRRGGGGGDDDHDGGELAAAATSHACREVSSRKCVQTPLSFFGFLPCSCSSHGIVFQSYGRCPAFSCIFLWQFCSEDSSQQMTICRFIHVFAREYLFV